MTPLTITAPEGVLVERLDPGFFSSGAIAAERWFQLAAW
jgi:hypothetical protein